MFSVWRMFVFQLLKRLIASKYPKIQWLTVQELGQWLEDPAKSKPVLLDTRTEAEYAVSHLKDAQRIDPILPELAGLREMPVDTAIVVYCSVGYRSARVAKQLEQAGFNRVYNLEGSIFEWVNEGRPIFKDDLPAQLVHPYDSFWGKLVKSQYRAAIVA